ncbi:hypothetical protein B0H11DRAFT_2209049 [Mycena galericulata]|nr:hypothetical protein B0H11DRAFT_2209049 [Mycena galericulata]
MAPASIDLNNLPPLEEIKGGSINNLHKKELFTVAKALGMEMPSKASNLAKPALLDQVKVLLTATTDVRFLKFKVHRPETTGGAALKNSADKAKEDSEASAKKDDTALSGANKKLIEKQVKIDPPPQHKRLAGSKVKSEASAQDANYSADSSLTQDTDSDVEGKEISVPSSPKDIGIPPGNEAVITPSNTNEVIAPNGKAMNVDEFPIVVTFLGSDSGREIWIVPNERGEVTVSKTPEGTYTSSWKKIIPRALVQFSPAKGSQNLKISINGPTGNPLPLGTANDFMKGNLPPVLSLKEADTCTLIQKGSLLVCEVFLGPAIPVNTVKLEDSEFMGEIKPLDLAKERGTVPKKTKAGRRDRDFVDSDEDSGSHKNDQDFLEFLCILLHGKTDGYGKALKTVGEMRGRFHDLQRAIAYCDTNYPSSSREAAAYRVPANYGDHVNSEYQKFTNRPFNKREVELALKIGHTIASQDRQLFKSPLLAYDSVAQSWVDGAKDLDEEVVTNFNQMTRRQFIAHLEKSKLEAEKAREKEAKEERKKRKRDRKHVSSSEDSVTDSEQERRERERRKQRKREKAREAESSRSKKKSKGSDASEHLDSN